MTRRLSLSLSLAMLVAGVVLLVAAGLASATDAPRGGTLRVSGVSDVDYVDPALAYSVWSWPVVYATCAKLFNYPDETGAAGARLVPEVVDRYAISKDGRTYTFDLKRTFRFHTGARVTAQSFAAAFDRDAQPKMDSPATFYMREIVGASDVIDGNATSISGITTPGPYRLRIQLTRAVGDFTARLTLPFFCPVLPRTPIDPEGVDDPPGSGPYYVAERVVNQRIVLKRNPYYRGSRPANVDQVVWTFGTSREDCIAALEQDRVDNCGLFGLPAATVRRLAAVYGMNREAGQFFVSPALTTWFIGFNHDRPAFAEPGQVPLAKAINYAIDRPEMTRAFGYLIGKRTDQLLPPALARRASIYPLEGADPVTARKWLARARFRPRELVFYANSNPIGVAIAQVVVFNLKQIGIDVAVRYFDTAALFLRAATPGEPYDLIMLGWSADYADGGAFFAPLLADGGSQSGTRLRDPRLTARMNAAQRQTGKARHDAWADLDVDLMRDDPPWAPFANTQSVDLVSRTVGCVVVHPVYHFDVVAACKKR